MAVPWLLFAVLGLAAKEVSCQNELDFGDPPPLPTKGIFLYINNSYCKLANSSIIIVS